MQTAYLAAAVLGGLLLLIQLVMSLFGGDGDVSPDIEFHAELHPGTLDATDFASLLSFRTVVAFVTFFGIGGMGASTAGLSPTWTFVSAIALGGGAFLVVGLALLQFARLRSSGTVDIQNTVGTQGQVYLTVPASKGGEGAVTVVVQGRSMQFKAITSGDELATGVLCKIVAVRGTGTLEVVPL